MIYRSNEIEKFRDILEGREYYFHDGSIKRFDYDLSNKEFNFSVHSYEGCLIEMHFRNVIFFYITNQKFLYLEGMERLIVLDVGLEESTKMFDCMVKEREANQFYDAKADYSQMFNFGIQKLDGTEIFIVCDEIEINKIYDED